MATPAGLPPPTDKQGEGAIVITPIMQAEAIPGASIALADDFKFEVTWTTPGGPVTRGTLDHCLRRVATEQGWSEQDLTDTLAYNA